MGRVAGYILPMAHRRILIVEDDADVREALAEAMADAGAEVVVASDGVDALEALRAGPRPSLILLDLRLPRLGGDEFLRELRSDPRFEHLPVITMTGGTGAAGGGEIVARLKKPIDLDDLRQIVLSLFDDVAA
jgi:CheY-like chemotaxis protein